jgi:hypothetical protein
MFNTFRILRYINYQYRTKLYDPDWIVNIETEEELDHVIQLFKDYLNLLPGLNFNITLEVQYAILWNYTFTDKIINPKAKPYLWIVHQSPLELGIPDFMPRYYKNEIEAKHHQDHQRINGVGETSIKVTLRNCLIKPPTQGLKIQSKVTLRETSNLSR